MAGQSVTIAGASYSDVPGVTLNKTGGGTAYFADVSDTTATASDVASGKYFYTAAGVKTAGTASGGSGTITINDVANTTGTTAEITNVTATHHVIHLEFSDSTDTDIDVYYDDAMIGTMITSYEPVTYSSKTVTLAQLDGVTWYQPSVIPLNTQLIDYTKCSSNTAINAQGQAVAQDWYYASDYTAIEPGMRFAYRGGYWFYLAFYDSSKSVIAAVSLSQYSTQDPNDTNTGYGNIAAQNVPANAKYMRLCGTYPDSDHISLIRTE